MEPQLEYKTLKSKRYGLDQGKYLQAVASIYSKGIFCVRNARTYIKSASKKLSVWLAKASEDVVIGDF